MVSRTRRSWILVVVGVAVFAVTAVLILNALGSSGYPASRAAETVRASLDLGDRLAEELGLGPIEWVRTPIVGACGYITVRDDEHRDQWVASVIAPEIGVADVANAAGAVGGAASNTDTIADSVFVLVTGADDAKGRVDIEVSPSGEVRFNVDSPCYVGTMTDEDVGQG